jgi:uncharacterized repeat protein (TIGR01451 family)
VTYAVPIATDLVDPSPTVNCLPASGTNFPIGVTNVTCTATDASGNMASDSFTVTVTVTPEANLSVTMIESPDPVMVEGSLTYTITVTNNGPDDAPGASVSNQLPPAVAFVSASPTQGSCYENAGLVLCDLGTLANGGSARSRP